jgi:hypothetical protein
MFRVPEVRRSQYAFSVRGALLLVLSVLHLSFSYGPLLADGSEAALPIAASLAIIGFDLRLRSRDYETGQLARIVA